MIFWLHGKNVFNFFCCWQIYRLLLYQQNKISVQKQNYFLSKIKSFHLTPSQSKHIVQFRYGKTKMKSFRHRQYQCCDSIPVSTLTVYFTWNLSGKPRSGFKIKSGWTKKKLKKFRWGFWKWNFFDVIEHRLSILLHR